jgi:hypothetical protein
MNDQPNKAATNKPDAKTDKDKPPEWTFVRKIAISLSQIMF